MPDLIYNVKFNIDDNLQEGVAGAERYEQQVEELEMQVAELTAQLKRATDQQDRFAQGGKTTGAVVGKTNKQLALGNQLFFSLSDGIQDSAQFSQGFSTGMRAIGNNIGFTAELMTMYIAQTAALNGGTKSLSATMKALGRSLMGAGGIILAINTAITLITLFSQKSKKAESDVKSLGDAFASVSKEISSSVFGDGSYLFTQGVIADLGNEFNMLSKQLEESTGFFKNISNTMINDFRIASDETIKNNRLFSKSQQENAATTKASEAQLKELIKTTSQKIGVDEKEAAVILEKIGAETEEIRNKELMRKALIALIPEAQEYFDIQDKTTNLQNKASEISEDYNSIILEQQTGLELTSATLKQLEQDIRSEMVAIASSNIAQAEKNKLLKEYQGILDELAGEDVSPIEAMSNRVNVALAMFNLGLDENKNGLMAIQSEATGFLFEMSDNISNLTDAEILELSKLAEEIRKLGVELEITGSKAKTTEEKIAGFASGFSAYAQETQRLVSSLSSLVAASEAETEAQARKQFETQKKLSYASAVVVGAEAVVKALATKPAPNFPLAAIAAAATGIQIAAIAKQKFSYGGGASEFSGGATSALSTYGSGQSLPESRGLLSGSQVDTGRTPAFDGRGEGMSQQPIIINNYANVDSEGLYLTTEYGRKSYQQSAL